LGERLRSGRYDVLIPPHDEVFLLSRVQDALAQKAAVAIPDFNYITLLQSKIQFYELAKEIDLPQPDAQVIADQQEFDCWNDYPRFVKLDFGTAGQTVRLVHDRHELMKALRDFQEHGWWQPGIPMMMQKPATGSQGFVRAIFRRGELVAHHATVLLRRGVGGAAVAKAAVAHPRVAEHMRRLGARLQWHGALFCDYFYDEASGLPQYIEANPRIGDSANATFSGVNLTQQWVNVARSDDVRPLPTANAGVRSHSGMLILMSLALEGAGRTELWRELRKQRRGQGLYEGSRDELTRPNQDALSALAFGWIAARLLIRPASAHGLVRRTVANYALTAEAAQRIREIPLEKLLACLNG
jgi:predicted ATP-grasp superfamily ATP-dependent carboligase